MYLECGVSLSNQGLRSNWNKQVDAAAHSATVKCRFLCALCVFPFLRSCFLTRRTTRPLSECQRLSAPQWASVNRHKLALSKALNQRAAPLSSLPAFPVPFSFSFPFSPALTQQGDAHPSLHPPPKHSSWAEGPRRFPYLPAGLLPDPVPPPWTEQSLTGPRPCPESCDHVCALPKVQRWPWWTPAFTFSSGNQREKHKTMVNVQRGCSKDSSPLFIYLFICSFTHLSFIYKMKRIVNSNCN